MGYSLDQTIWAAAQEVHNSLEGSSDGVAATVGRGLVGIEFDYNPRLSDIAKTIPGFAFERAARLCVGPLEEYDEISKALARMRFVSSQLRLARADIFAKARAARPSFEATTVLVKEGGSFAGPIVASNAYYCAQDIGGGLVKIHDAAVIKAAPPVGKNMLVDYGGGKAVAVSPI
jgi:hypothetical protein